jgi:hypothetical protein
MSGSFETVIIELDGSETYRLQMAKIGVGNGATEPPASSNYLTVNDGEDNAVRKGETTDVTLAVRDRYNNPVSDATVKASVSNGDFDEQNNQSSTGVGGEVSFTYNATGVASGTTEQLNFTLDERRSKFNQSTRRNVTVNVSVTAAGGNTGSGNSGPGSYSVEWTTENGDNFTVDLAGAANESKELNASASLEVQGLNFDYAVNNTQVTNITREEGVTNSTGQNSTVLNATQTGGVAVYVVSGGTTDVINVSVENTTSGGGTGGFQSARATAMLPDTTTQGQSIYLSPDTEIPSDTAINISLDDPQDGTVNYGNGISSFEVNASTGARNSNASPNAFLNFTLTEAVSDGLRVSMPNVDTTGAAGYDITATREDTGTSTTASFDLDYDTGDAEISSFTAEDLLADTSGQVQTLTFELSSSLPADKPVTIGLAPAQGSGDVLYQGLGGNDGVNISTNSEDFDQNGGQARVTIRPSSDLAAGTTVAVNLSANTDAMTNAPYEIGISRGDADTASTTFGITNRQPTADAGGTYSVDEGSTVSLDGTGSSDPDGDMLSYTWSIQGTDYGATISNPNSATPTFDASGASVSQDRDVTVELQVSDGNGGTDTTTTTVTIQQSPKADNVVVAQSSINNGNIVVQFRNNNNRPVTFSRARLDSYSEASTPGNPNRGPIDRVIYNSGAELVSGDSLEPVSGPTLSNGANQDVTFDPKRLQTNNNQVRDADAQSGDTMTITIEFDDGSTEQYVINL